MPITSPIIPWYIKSLPGMNTKGENLELQDKFVVKAQNVRFEPEPGGISKRDAIAYFNTASLGSGAIVGSFRYYTSGGATLFVVTHGTKTYVGNDATGAFTEIRDSLTDSKRMAFLTYKDLLICSNGYDNLFAYDGDTTNNVTWELGSCKAIIGAAGAITRTSLSYAVTMDNDAYVCGAVSNEIASVTAEDISLSWIPTGPTGTLNRKIYRKSSETGGAYKLIATIADNTTTTYSDSTADASAAAVMPSVTDDFPKGAYLQLHRERLFISGDPSNVNRIYYSNPYLPWFIQQTLNLDYMDITPEDNDEISGIPIHLGVMVCIKKNSMRKIHITTPVFGGDPTTWYADDPISWIGSPAPWSITQTPYGIIFLGWDAWYMFDGAKPSIIIDEFDTAEILRASYSETVGYWHRGVFLAAYTDATIAAQYHDRVMRFNMKRSRLSYDLLDANCFAAKRGDDESGEIYYGNSQNGYLLMAENEELTYRLRTKTEANAGAKLDSYVGGTEASPYIQIGDITSASAIPDDIIIFWDNDSDVPGTGWTEITDDDDRLIYLSATGVGTQTAGTSHLHNVADTLEDNNSTTTKNNHFGGTSAASMPHDHTVDEDSDAATPFPRYTTLRMFKKNNTTTEYEFPDGAIVMYGEGAAPTGWQNWDNNGYYIKIDSDDTNLGDAISSIHEHPFTFTTDLDTSAASSDNGTHSATQNHTHEMTGTLQATTQDDWELAYVSFRFMKKVGETDTWDGVSNYVYALYDSGGAPGAGWSEVTTYEGMFLKVGNSQPATGSAENASHTHVMPNGTTAEGTPLTGSDAVPDVQSQSNHTHDWIDFEPSSEDAEIPPYVKYRLFRKVLGQMKDYNDGLVSTYTEGVWVSPSAQLNAESLTKLYWNEDRDSGDTIELFIRTGATSAAVTDATSCTADNTTEKFTAVGHGLVNTNRVQIGGTAVPTGIADDLIYYVVGVAGNDFQVSLTSGGAAVAFSDDGVAVTFKKWSDAYTDPNGSIIAETPDIWLQYLVAFTAVDTTVSNPKIYHTDGYVIKITYKKGATLFETAVEYIYDIGFRNFDQPAMDKIFKKIVSWHEGDTGSFTIYWETENSTGEFVIDLTVNSERWDSFFPSTAMGRQLKLQIYKNDLYDFKFKEFQGFMTPEPIIV